MYSDPFVFFELDRRTATASDIKRAYAARLKTTRPDDDPAGFMELRAALDGALNQVKWRDQNPQPAYEDDYDDEDEDGDEDDEPQSFEASSPSPEITAPPCPSAEKPDITLPSNSGAEFRTPSDDERIEPTPDIDLPPNSGAEFEQPLDPWAVDEEIAPSAPPVPPKTKSPFALSPEQHRAAAMEDIEDLLKSTSRSEWASWLNILDRPAFESLDDFQALSGELRTFLCNKTGFKESLPRPRLPDDLPAAIIIRLDDRFGWTQQSGREWYERDLNLWIARLVKAAEWQSGETSEASRTQKFFQEHTSTQTSDKPVRKERSLAFNIGWTVFRLFILFTLVQAIVQLLSE